MISIEKNCDSIPSDFSGTAENIHEISVVFFNMMQIHRDSEPHFLYKKSEDDDGDKIKQINWL